MAEYTNPMMEGALDFDSEIDVDATAPEFSVLPEGDYYFTVEKVERDYVKTDGGSKYAGCPMAKVTVRIKGTDENGEDAEISRTENFILHTKFAWKLSQLFVCVGLAKNGDKLRMNWQALPTLTGKCHVKVRTYKKKDGSEGRGNEITTWYEPETAGAATPAWKMGY